MTLQIWRKGVGQWRRVVHEAALAACIGGAVEKAEAVE